MAACTSSAIWASIRAGLRVVGEDVARQPEGHRQRDQVLLRSVVQVPLDPAPLRVAAGHDPA